jgi:hypothetical protein
MLDLREDLIHREISTMMMIMDLVEVKRCLEDHLDLLSCIVVTWVVQAPDKEDNNPEMKKYMKKMKEIKVMAEDLNNKGQQTKKKRINTSP